MGISNSPEEILVNDDVTSETLRQIWDHSVGDLPLNNLLICDVRGVSMPCKYVGSILSRKFRKNGKEEFVMRPTGLLANRTLFKVGSSVEMKKILGVGHFNVGNRAFTISK